ncbi:hypothetical protein PIB30_025555 [Stylosanthes scabra]|uniref:Uncharacterized protein n=1 Tax=Stylosanthes scabra TaxID=79078 RepID=A0ABU6QAA7_9FABA|nr:hypothetical protein [Stylosanthes scabra]
MRSLKFERKKPRKARGGDMEICSSWCCFNCAWIVFSVKLWPNIDVFTRHKSKAKFLILGFTTIYSFFADRALKGKPDVYNMISYAAFAFLSSTCNFVELTYNMQIN